MTLRDGPYRARSLGGAARVVVNLADHTAEIASSSVGPRHRRRKQRQVGEGKGKSESNDNNTGSAIPEKPHPQRHTPLGKLQTQQLLQAAVTTNVDGLWQVHPSRLLEYSPRALHTVGWFPWPSKLHLSVTVFANKSLHIQTLVIVAWTAIIHATHGLGINYTYQQHFKAIFGTAYLGSLASMGVIIALVLGLFISLVVQRWWEVRVQYAAFHHALLELANSFAVRSEYDLLSAATGVTTANTRTPTSSPSTIDTLNRKRKSKTLKKVKSELFRLLNLAHVLFLSQAGEREESVKGARALQRGEGRHNFLFRRNNLKKLSQTERTSAFGGDDAAATRPSSPLDADDVEITVEHDETCSGTDNSLDADTSAARVRSDSIDENTTTPPRNPMSKQSGHVRNSTVIFQDDDILSKHVTHLDHDDLIALGLVTPEEWETLRNARTAGMPRFSAVLIWASTLIHESNVRGLCCDGTKSQALQKITDARQAAGRVLTYLATQLPYTYVNLVSLVVHVYLFVLSTWFGFICATGLNKLNLDGVGVESESIVAVGDSVGTPVTKITENNTSLTSDYLTLTFVYFFLVFSNVLFQGLLNIHALLDNPFGHHPAKFPLRAFVAQLVGATSALLRDKHLPPRDSPSVTVFFSDADDGSSSSQSGSESDDP